MAYHGPDGDSGICLCQTVIKIISIYREETSMKLPPGSVEKQPRSKFAIVTISQVSMKEVFKNRPNTHSEYRPK